jgi:hypothetical protein
MSTVEISEKALEAARREAQRRGTEVSDVVDEAVQRFIVGVDLRNLLDEFRRQDATDDSALIEEDALRIASEELDAVRTQPAPGTSNSS